MFHEFKFWREMFRDVFIESRAGLARTGEKGGGGGGGVRCPGEQLIDGGTAASGASHADESIEVTSLGFSPFFSSSSFSSGCTKKEGVWEVRRRRIRKVSSAEVSRCVMTAVQSTESQNTNLVSFIP